MAGLLLVFAVAGWLWRAPASAAPQVVRYHVTDLGTLPNQQLSTPAAINNQAQVAGWTEAFAFRYTDGVMENLGTLPGGSVSEAKGINGLGHVVGDSQFANGGAIRHATLWRDGTINDLGFIPAAGNYSIATAVNDATVVVGYGAPSLSSTNTRAFIWDAASGISDLGLGTGSKALGINNAGTVTGAAPFTGGIHAFVRPANGGARDIGTIAGPASVGNFINDNGHVAGSSTSNNFDNRQHAFLWDGTMHDLGSLGPNDVLSDRSFAYGINIHDEVVGSTYRPYNGGALFQIAFVHRDGQMFDLETLVDESGADYRLYSANAINDAGQIVVDAIKISTNQKHAVLLTPFTAATPTPTPTPTPAAPAPRLDGLSAQSTTRSGLVVATGANFGAQQGASRVTVGGVNAIVMRWTDTAIQFYVPEGAAAGSNPVQVTNANGASNTLPLVVTLRAQSGRIRWRFTVAAEYTAFHPGLAADGTIYVNDVQGRTYALTPDGGLKWVVQTGLTGADGPVSVGPDGTIYVMSILPNGQTGRASASDPAIIALNPDGSEKWHYLATGGVSGRGGPNVGPDGKIYAIVRPESVPSAHNVFALNPDGTLAWNYNEGIYKYGQLGDKDIVFGRTVPQLYFQYESLNRDNHIPQLWAFGLDGALHWTQRASNDDTAVSPLDDSAHTPMQAFTPLGTLLWAIPLFGQGPTTGPDVGPDGVHYVTQNYNTLFAVNPDGTEKWRVPTGGILYQQVAGPANNVVFSGGIVTYGQPGFFVGYSTANGAEVFRIPLPNEPGFGEYGQVRPDTRPVFTPDGATAYSGADVAGAGYDPDPNRRYSFFYAVDTTTELPCSYSITPQAQVFPANGGSGTINVNATSTSCAWTAQSNASWITITAGASGAGNGTVAYNVAANDAAAPRTGTIVVAGRTFTVTQPGTPATLPRVRLTYPAEGAHLTQPTNVFVRADATPAAGRTITRVEFYAGSQLIGTDTSAPYQIVWNNPPTASYALTAKAFDSAGESNTSQPVNLTLDPPTGGGPFPLPIPPPTLNSPQAGQTFNAPANIELTATPAASQYPVFRVEFYADTTLLGSDSTAPYTFTWTNVPAGRYAVSARTVANTGARATSQPFDINVVAPSFQIGGRVADSYGTPLAGVSVMLSGASGATATTDAAGNYSFTNVAGGASYTVTAAASGWTFSPGTATFDNLSGNQTADFNVVRPAVANGPLLISEFRLSGPAGARDEFVELYNNTDAPLTVQTADGSPGWAVVSLADEGLRVVIPNGTTIPARGHYLVADSAGYSLAALAAADSTFNFDLPDDAGLALFNTSDPQGFTSGNVIDSVGFDGATGAPAALYREGTPLAPVGATVNAAEQYSLVRRQATGTPRDTGDNAADFVRVSASGTIAGANAELGAPAPEGLNGPVQRNATLKVGLIEPQQSSTAAPNRVRDTTANACGGANCALGTLTIRRRFTNKTGQMVTALRFRIVDVTTLNSPGAGASQADLRALDSIDVTVTTSGGNVLVKGTALDAPAQSSGGGLNSALVVQLPGGALAPNASVNVQFVLGVQQGGSFRFLVNVEALTPTQAGAQKVEAARPSK
ncbi:MAG TPA: Ig-like domain-containing protein [Pyrinomonadaceae bacterium]|jgi:probable HAF family extracellular repeat protein